MFISIDEGNQTLSASIPLTTPSGKIRVKQRSMLNEYGIPIATKRDEMNSNCYIEWQISYDEDILEKEKKNQTLTSLEHLRFDGSNGKEKALYELSEYIYYFYKWGIIQKEKLDTIKEYVNSFNEEDLLDKNKECAITRNHSIEKEILGIKFSATQINYPLLIYKFECYEIIAEITIREKQRAIGVQPMLYFCFPITELRPKDLIGRVAETKETGYFTINADNISVFLEMLKIFGILTARHRQDVVSIIDLILDQ